MEVVGGAKIYGRIVLEKRPFLVINKLISPGTFLIEIFKKYILICKCSVFVFRNSNKSKFIDIFMRQKLCLYLRSLSHNTTSENRSMFYAPNSFSIKLLWVFL